MNYKENDLLFLKIFDDIDNIMNDNFYHEKDSLIKIKQIIQNWYNEFTNKKTLKKINLEELKFVDSEVTDLFDAYVQTESTKNNFTERLYFNFSILKKSWKDEMLGGD